MLKRLAFFFLLFLVGLICLTTILVLRNTNSYQYDSLQEDKQQQQHHMNRIKIASETKLHSTEKPIDEINAQMGQIENQKQEAKIFSKEKNAPKTTVTLCRSTIVGNRYITDSRGYTCKFENLDRMSHCCSTQTQTKPMRYACKTCDTKLACCSVYEHCVACCMAPERREELTNNFEKRKNDRLYKGITTVFQFCSTRCRTTSRSVINENRYRSPLKHCYGQNDPADLELPTTVMNSYP